MKSEFQKRLNEALSLRYMRPVDLVKASGISKGRISQYMKGLYKPKIDSLITIAKALNVNYRWLNGDDVPMSEFDQETADNFLIHKNKYKNYNTKKLAKGSNAYDIIQEYFGKQAAELVNLFINFNEEGKEKLLDTAIDMSNLERYKKDNQSDVVLKKHKPK